MAQYRGAVFLSACWLLTGSSAMARECPSVDPAEADSRALALLAATGPAASGGDMLPALEQAVCFAAQSDNPDTRIYANGRLGRALLQQGSLTAAYSYLLDGTEQAAAANRPATAAALFNDLGVLERSRNQLSAATEAFKNCYALAPSGSPLHSVAGLNLARAYAESGDWPAAQAQLGNALDDIEAMPPDPDKANALLGLAEIYRESAAIAAEPGAVRARANRYYDAAIDLAVALDEPRLVAYGVGYQALLYRDQGESAAALGLAREAAMLSQQAGAVDGVFVWQWQAGRLLQVLQQPAAALDSYAVAAGALQALADRYGIFSSQQFNEQVRPFYLEYADLLLNQARDAGGALDQQRLEAVLQLNNSLKAAEAKDYFDEDCLLTAAEGTTAAQLEANVAVVTPIIFADRIEVLTRIRGQVVRYASAVSSQELRRTLLRFRRAIVERNTAEWRRESGRIYGWLVEPVIVPLREAGIDTLVFVPDGPLRAIPFAALSDGERFLVEEFAIASVLSLEQTSTGPADRDARPAALLSGLTESVQGFAALPAVAGEISAVAALTEATVLQDAGFTRDSLGRSLSRGDYSIVHVATHAQFQSDYRQSFLLTHEGKFDLSALDSAIRSRKAAGKPIDLMVLSACETAVGDDLAALGLAGITLKAGVRSAIASLWPVNDVSTAQLMQALYAQLAQPETGKAAAMRAAQLQLLQDENYAEPYYWAAFMLVGDWL